MSKYPLITQIIQELYASGDLTKAASLHVEPEYGFFGRIEYADGSVRVFRLMDLGVNAHGASQLAKDKAYTKHFLQHLGYRVPQGKTFITAQFFKTHPTTYLDDIGEVATIAAVQAYIESNVGYPCFIKPNDSSQGHGVYKCHQGQDVEKAISVLYHDVFDTILVEATVSYPEYRVVVYQDQLICAYRKTAVAVMGDGDQPVRELIAALQAQFVQANRPTKLGWDDPQIALLLQQQGVTFDSIPAAGRKIYLADTSNLSRGGMVEDVTQSIHPYWRDLAIEAVQRFGLAFCGMDLCCADITQPDSDYAILELNSSPSMAQYARSSPQAAQLTRQALKSILNQEI